MKTFGAVARVGFMAVAWVLVGMIFVQVFHAGAAVLVSPGEWGAHRNLGHLFAPPIMLMGLLSLIGWMPYRFGLFSLGLFLLYTLQYVWIHLPVGSLAALHPVGALLMLLVALAAARGAWRLACAGWAPGWRAALAAGASLLALWVAVAAVGAGPGGGGAVAASTSGEIPAAYRSLQSPFASDDAAAVAAGEQIARQQCVVCHAADFKGKPFSADLTQAAATRSDQFLMWVISEGTPKGMPAWRSKLSEEERWQVIAFLRSLQR